MTYEKNYTSTPGVHGCVCTGKLFKGWSRWFAEKGIDRQTVCTPSGGDQGRMSSNTGAAYFQLRTNTGDQGWQTC